MKGLVIKNTGSWYQVKTDDGQSIECKIKGNFRLKGIRSTNPVAVGDRVRIILNQEGTAFISEIEDRKNYIIRRSSNLSKQSHILAANLDQCMLVVTINYPETSTIFIDRFLASAEAYRVPVKLVFNKVDAYDEDELRYLDALINLYTQIGYPCFKVSAKSGTGVAEIKKALEGKITLFSGHSGVGKSTLINSILPGIAAKTGEISSYHNKGMHTTTFSEMFPVEGDGYIIDTPGIKGFGTFDMEEEEIGHYFPEIFKTSADCKYGNCTHRHEPGCAVRKAVEEHLISESRYTSYLNMLEDKEEEKHRIPQHDPAPRHAEQQNARHQVPCDSGGKSVTGAHLQTPESLPLHFHPPSHSQRQDRENGHRCRRRRRNLDRRFHPACSVQQGGRKPQPACKALQFWRCGHRADPSENS